MKPGSEIKCPHCESDAFAIKKTEMDGWTNLGEILACSACDAKIADYDQTTYSDNKTTSAKSALSSFLDVEEEEKKVLQVSEEEKQFCRDCGHYIEHPFLSRCSLLDKTVNPMDDCQEFIKKKKASSKKKE